MNFRRIAVATLTVVGISFVCSPIAAADDATFIGEVSNYMSDTYFDDATVHSVIADAKKVCSMSDAGFSDAAMGYINDKWNPSDVFGFMLAATRAYCPNHLSEWSGL